MSRGTRSEVEGRRSKVEGRKSGFRLSTFDLRFLLPTSINNHRVVSPAIDDDRFVVAPARQRVGLRSRADRTLVEGAFEAELPRIAGNLVAEDANVADDRLHARGELLGVG